MRKVRISKETAVQKILNSKGKMFTVEWVKKNGQTRRINGKFIRPTVKRQNQDKIFGYLSVYDPHNRTTRRVDTRNIKTLAIDKRVYSIG